LILPGFERTLVIFDCFYITIRMRVKHIKLIYYNYKTFLFYMYLSPGKLVFLRTFNFQMNGP